MQNLFAYRIQDFYLKLFLHTTDLQLTMTLSQVIIQFFMLLAEQ